MTPFDVRCVAYAAQGARLGVLPEWLSLSATVGFNGSYGTMQLRYTRDAIHGTVLDRPLASGTELALEIWNGTTWSEPLGSRFLVLDRTVTPGDDHGVIDITAVSYGWISTKVRSLNTGALLPPDDPSHPSKRPFLSQTPGRVVATILDEWASRGGSWTRSFSVSQDSANVSWAQSGTWHFAHAQALDVILGSLVAAGMCDWTTNGRTLVMYNAETQLDRDLSPTVRVQLGADITEAPSQETIADLVARIGFSGGRLDPEDNALLYHTEYDPSAPAPWGPWEGEYSNNSITTLGGAQSALQRRLGEAGRVRGQYTRDMANAGMAGHVPLVDFRPGDWITAPGVNGEAEKLRVQQIIIRHDGDKPTAGLLLNDVLLDAQLRRALRDRGLEDGTHSGGGSETPPPLPTPPPDNTQPGVPTGLASTTEGYFLGNGQPAAWVALSWTPVTTNVNGQPMSVSEYDAAFRQGTTENWSSARRVTTGTTTTFDGLNPGLSHQFRVRALNPETQKPGAWSVIHTRTTAHPNDPPPVPSTPTLTTRLGIITWTWDGLSNTAGPMPTHFRRVEIAMTNNPSTNPPGSAVVDTLAGAGSRPIDRQPIGSTRYFRLRSVGTGGTSAWSPQVSITVQGIQGPDLEADNIWANSAWLGSAHAEIFRTGGIPESALGFGTDELLPNPMWLDAEQRAVYPMTPSGMSYSTAATALRKGQTHTVAFSGASVTAGAEADISGEISVTPGEKIALEMYARRANNATYNVQLVLRVRNIAGGISRVGVTVTPSDIGNNQNGSVQGVVTIPDGATAATFALRCATNGTGLWYISEVSARRALTSGDVGAGGEMTAMGIRFWDADTTWFDLDTSIRRVSMRGELHAVDNQGRGVRVLPPGSGFGGFLIFENDVPVSPYIASGGTAQGSTERGTLTMVSGLTTSTGWRARIRLEPSGEFDIGGAPSGGQTGNEPYRIRATTSNRLRLESNRPNGTVDLQTQGAQGVRMLTGGGEMRWHLSDTFFTARPVWESSATGSANLTIHSTDGGRIDRITSLRKDKLDIEDLPDEQAVDVARAIRLRTWVDRATRERGELEHRILGAVAEEVEESTTADWAVVRDGDGELQSIPYDRLGLLGLAWCRVLEQRINELESS